MLEGVPKILNVNDDEATRYLLTKYLKGAGLVTVEAATGRAALEAAARERPDLIILDVNLPDVNGFQVCRKLKSEPATSSIAVLLISASFVKSENRVEGLDEGADGYLSQPLEPAELIATVKALLRMREAESSARALSAHWQSTFDAISDSVCLLDESGRVIRCNASVQKVLNRSGKEVVGQGLAELLGQWGPVDPRLTEALRASDPSEIGDLKLGSDRWYRVSAGVVKGDDGQPVNRVCVLTEVTENRRLEEALRERAEALAAADRRKDELLAMLAHELRNPLAAISAGMQTLDRIGSQEQKPTRMRALVLRQTKHLARLVDDLLDVSRITRGKIELRKEPVELGAAISRAAELVRPTLEERKHQLELALEGDPVWVHADPTRIEQVLINLLDNAAKYTLPGGRVAVSLRGEGGLAVIRVEDSGVGIRPEMLDRIFELFAQVEQSLDRSRGGLGIGLTLVRSLIQMHGGEVSAQSGGVGKGSQFVVRLPRTAAPVSELQRAPPGRAAGRRSVLLVEDNPDAREALRDLLEDSGHTVEVATDGMAGVERAIALQPDVALVDIGLPGMDGFQVARSLRAHPEGRGLFLIALTGYGGSQQRTEALEAGFDLHLVKPVDPDELMRVLEGRHAAIRPVNLEPGLS